jgi:hypothetical protein
MGGGYPFPGGFTDTQGILGTLRVIKEIRDTFKDGFGTDQKVLSRLEAVEKKLDAIKPADLISEDYKKFKQNTDDALKGINESLKTIRADIKKLQGK